MKIGIDASPMMGERGGVGWYTFHLLQALVQLKEDLELVCYVRRGGLWPRREPLQEWTLSESLRWVESGRLTMPWRGAWDRLDLYHGTNYKLQTIGRFGGVVTIYDLWLDRNPEYSKKLLGQRFSFYRTRRTAWKARKVVTVSNHSARDLEAIYGLPRERIAVIHGGVSDEFRPTPDAEALARLGRRLRVPLDRFILFLGGADPRKNHRTLLSAYAHRVDSLKPWRLVIVGNPEDRFGNIMETASGLGLQDRVACAGSLAMSDLRLLYSHADAFVFPSLYEGFGMPVLEAMACGTPVITSNTTALPEVAGDAALLVNPEDAKALGDAILRVLQDSALQESLRTKGFERVKQFTWERAARHTLAVYREICQ